MKILNLVQGSDEWAAHRAQHFNASDAPAMLGCSPYKQRSQLLREIATGVSAEISDVTQNLFDKGHRAEALARPLAERLIGEELFPVVGFEGPYSASFDGLTMDYQTGFEHKSLNDDLRRAFAALKTREFETDPMTAVRACLPEHLRAQMEQQCMVSGATRVLFVASKWDSNGELVEEQHCWYYPDADLRARIVAGWKQFADDVAAYAPTPEAAPVAVGRAPETLPALHIEVTGMVTASNLQEFRDHAIAVFQGINTDLKTDDDFASAEKTVKWCGDIESRLEAAKQHALSQTESIDQLFRAIDEIKSEARAKRLELDKLVSARKEAIRHEIVATARKVYDAHVEAMKADTGGPWVLTGYPDFGGAIKGKRTVSSMQDAVDTVLANAKIAASESARTIRAALACLDEEAAGFEHLFADRVTFAGKAVEDVRVLARARITEFQKQQDAKLEAERDRIRKEEEARARASVESQNARERAVETEQPLPAVGGGLGNYTGELRAAGEPGRAIAKPPTSSQIKLGDINAAIAPLSITAEGLAQIGFESVGTKGAAKLYRESDFNAICRELIARLETACAKRAA